MKIYNLCKVFLICIFIFTCFPSNVKAEMFNIDKVVLIDPGHGGIDGGAVSKNNTLEKDLNLEMSIKLKEVLESKGYKVFMTREDDISLSSNGSVKQQKRDDLNKRCSMKREVSCDVFVSIHMNKFPDASAKGSQVWYPFYSEKSKKLAENMHKQFKQVLNQQHNRQPKGVKNDYVILRDGYDGASVIVECGFISNDEEERKLKDESYQYEFCNSLGIAIDDYFNGR